MHLKVRSLVPAPALARRGSRRLTSVALTLLALACADRPRAPDNGRTRAEPPELTRSDAAPPPAPITVVDATGRTVELPRPARRVLSLVPAATETLVRLGAGKRLVGRTDYDVSPPAVAALPSVGGGLNPSIERILSLDPDLVIRFAAETDPHTPRRLDELGIRHFAVRPERIRDVRLMTHALGRLVGRPKAADSLITAMDARITAVREAVAHRPRPRVAYVLGGEPPRVAGPATFLHELIEIAGATNAFADLHGLYPAVSPEAFILRAPDLILAPEDALVTLPPHARLVRVPANLFHRPGPDLPLAAEHLARILHPEAFPRAARGDGDGGPPERPSWRANPGPALTPPRRGSPRGTLGTGDPKAPVPEWSLQPARPTRPLTAERGPEQESPGTASAPAPTPAPSPRPAALPTHAH